MAEMISPVLMGRDATYSGAAATPAAMESSTDQSFAETLSMQVQSDSAKTKSAKGQNTASANAERPPTPGTSSAATKDTQAVQSTEHEPQPSLATDSEQQADLTSNKTVTSQTPSLSDKAKTADKAAVDQSEHNTAEGEEEATSDHVAPDNTTGSWLAASDTPPLDAGQQPQEFELLKYLDQAISLGQKLKHVVLAKITPSAKEMTVQDTAPMLAGHGLAQEALALNEMNKASASTSPLAATTAEAEPSGQSVEGANTTNAQVQTTTGETADAVTGADVRAQADQDGTAAAQSELALSSGASGEQKTEGAATSEVVSSVATTAETADVTEVTQQPKTQQSMTQQQLEQQASSAAHTGQAKAASAAAAPEQVATPNQSAGAVTVEPVDAAVTVPLSTSESLAEAGGLTESPAESQRQKADVKLTTTAIAAELKQTDSTEKQVNEPVMVPSPLIATELRGSAASQAKQDSKTEKLTDKPGQQKLTAAEAKLNTEEALKQAKQQDLSDQTDSQSQQQTAGQAQFINHSETAARAEKAMSATSFAEQIKAAVQDKTTQQASVQSQQLNSQVQRQADVLSQKLNLIQPEASNQLKEQVMLMVKDKVQTAEIRLDPAELGAMQVKISMAQDQLSVQFVVQNGQTRDLMEQQMPKLRDLLQQQGIELSQGSVQQDSGSGRQSGDGSGQGRAAQAASGSGLNGASDEGQMVPVQIRTSERVVDYYA